MTSGIAFWKSIVVFDRRFCVCLSLLY